MSTTRNSLRYGMAVLLGAAALGHAAATPQEETVDLTTCPAPVQAAFTKAAEGGAIRRVRKVTEGDTVTYSARIEVLVDKEGKLLPPRPVPVEGEPAKAAADVAAASAAALATPVTLNVAGVRLQEVCSLLTGATGVEISCGNAFAGRLVTVTLKETPLGEALKVIADLTDTRADPREGGYRFRARAAAP